MGSDWNDRNRFNNREAGRRSGGQLDRSSSSTSPFGIEGSFSDRNSNDYYSREQGSQDNQGPTYRERESREYPDSSSNYGSIHHGSSRYGAQHTQNDRSYQADYRTQEYGADWRTPSYQTPQYQDRGSQQYQGRNSQHRDYNDRDRMIERGSNSGSGDIYYGRGNYDQSLSTYDGRSRGNSSYDSGSRGTNFGNGSSGVGGESSSFGSGYSTYGRDNDLNSYSRPNSSRPSFAGRGPKGWTRSDERIKEQVCDALERDHHIDASEIEVDVAQGIVTLKGSVEDRRTKRMAEDCVEHLSGVKDVRNELSVSASFFEQAKEVLTGESPSEKRTARSSRS